MNGSWADSFILLLCFGNGAESFAKFGATGVLSIREVDHFDTFIGEVFLRSD